MCNPGLAIAAAGVGISAASSITNHISAANEANRQNAANADFLAKNKQAAIDAAAHNEAQDTLRQSQEILAADAQLEDLNKQGNATRSAAVVSAAEAGLSGNSVDAIMNDIAVKNGVNKVRTGQNLQMKLDQLQQDKQGVLVDAQNNINTARQTVVRGPSMITPVFAIAGAGLNAYDAYQQRQARAGNGPTYTPTPGVTYGAGDVPNDAGAGDTYNPPSNTGNG